MVSPHTAQQLYQWNHVTNSDRERHAMMLAADMQLVYGIEPSQQAQQRFAAECGPLDRESRKQVEMRCPVTGEVYPHLAFEQYVAEFAEGETATFDEPGASKWLTAFADAWKNMTVRAAIQTVEVSELIVQPIERRLGCRRDHSFTIVILSESHEMCECQCRGLALAGNRIRKRRVALRSVPIGCVFALSGRRAVWTRLGVWQQQQQ